MTLMTGSHQALIRMTFSAVDHAIDELRWVLPAELLAWIDLDTLELCADRCMPGPLCRPVHTELLFSAAMHGHTGYIPMLFVGESRADPFLAVDVWHHAGILWRRFVRHHAGADRLPLVIPVVVHHGPEPLAGPVSMDALVDAPPAMCRALGRCMPGFGFFLDDLAREPDDVLRKRPMAALPRLTLWALRSAGHGRDLARRMQGWADELLAVVCAPHGVSCLATVLRYILERDPVEPGAIEALTAEVGHHAREAYMIAAEALQERAREQGRQEGRIEGRIEGRLLGRIETLRSLLEMLLGKRFGPLLPEVSGRIGQASGQELEAWIERLLDAGSLPDVFMEERAPDRLAQHG